MREFTGFTCSIPCFSGVYFRDFVSLRMLAQNALRSGRKFGLEFFPLHSEHPQWRENAAGRGYGSGLGFPGDGP